MESKKQIFFADFIRYDSRYQTFDFEFNDEPNALFEKNKPIKLWITNCSIGIYFFIGSIKISYNNKGKLQEDLCCFKGNDGEKSYGILGNECEMDRFQVQYIKVKDSILVKALEDLMKTR